MRAVRGDENMFWVLLQWILGSIAFAAFWMWLWPGIVPFGFWDLWVPKGGLNAFLWSLVCVWPMYLWAVSATLIGCKLCPERVVGDDYRETFKDGIKTSLRAGIMEEINFRWAGYMAQICAYMILNWIFVTFLFHWTVVQWLYFHITGPAANLITFGLMHQFLFSPIMSWATGAAILSSNRKFQAGHVYQGCLGWVNSWFLGMVFFYLTLTYGLISAIIVHVLYDFLIFSTEALIEKKVNGDLRRVRIAG